MATINGMFSVEVDESDRTAMLKAELTMREMMPGFAEELTKAGLKVSAHEVRKPRVKRAGEPAAAPVQQAAE